MPPGSKKKTNGKKGKSKKRCDSKNELKDSSKKDKDNNEFKALKEDRGLEDGVSQEIIKKMEIYKGTNEENIDPCEEEQNEEQEDDEGEEEGEGEEEEQKINQPFTEEQQKGEVLCRQDLVLNEQRQFLEMTKPQQSQQEKQQTKLQLQLQQQQVEIDESRILHKIEQIKAKLKEQQFFLMADKDLQAITGQLSSLLKQIPSKFNAMSTDKLLKEKERQKGLLISAQQLSEQFLNYISIANKKLNPKDPYLQTYQSWITQTIQKKNKNTQQVLNNMDDISAVQEAGHNQNQKKRISQTTTKSAKDFMSAEQKEFLREMEEKFIKLDKTKHITASKLKNTAKHISNIISSIKQLKQDNTTQTARNSIIGSTTGNIQTLRDSYDSEIKYLKSKQLQEQTKNRALTQKVSEIEQQEEKVVEKQDKNAALLESLEQNMTKFGDNQKVFSNYYKIRELKERMQRIVLDLKNEQRYAEKQSEKKAKTLRYAQKNISEVQRAIEEKSNEIGMLTSLMKEIASDPFSYQQIIREKAVKTYNLPPFFAFDYHLPQHLCADIFESQSYLDTQALLNETYQISQTPRCPSYARPLQDEQVEEKKIKGFIQRKSSVSRLSQSNQQLVRFTSKTEIHANNSKPAIPPVILNCKPTSQEQQQGTATEQFPQQDELERSSFSSSQNIIFPQFSESPSLTELNDEDDDELIIKSKQINHPSSYSEGQQNQQCLKAQRNFIQRTLTKSSATGGLAAMGSSGASKQINSDSKINLTKSSSQLEINPSLVNDFVHGFLFSQQRQPNNEPVPQKEGLDQQRIDQIEQTTTMIEDLKSLDKIREALKQRRSVLGVDSENRDIFQRQLLSRNGNHIIKIKNKENTSTSANFHLAIKSASKDAENNQNQGNQHNSSSQCFDHESNKKSSNNSNSEQSAFQITSKRSNEDKERTEEKRSQSDEVLLKESEISTTQFTHEMPLKNQNISRPYSSFELQKNYLERVNNSDQIIFSTERRSPDLRSGSKQKQQQHGMIRVSSPRALASKQGERDSFGNFTGNFLKDFRKDIQNRKEEEGQIQNANNINKQDKTNIEIEQIDQREEEENRQSADCQVRLSFSEITENEQKSESFLGLPEQTSELKQPALRQSSNKIWEVNSKTVVVRTTKQTRDIFSKITRISGTNNSVDLTTQINQRLPQQQSSGTKVLTSPSKTRQSQTTQLRQETLKTEGKEDYSPKEFTDFALKSPEKKPKTFGNNSTIAQKRWTPGIILKRTSNSVVSTPQKQNVSSSVFRESGLSQSQMKLALHNERSNQPKQQQQQQQQLASQDLGKQNDKVKGVISFLKRSKSVFNQEDKGNSTNNTSNHQNNSKQLNIVSKKLKQQPSDQLQMQVVMNPDIQNNYYRPKGHGKRLIYIKSKDLQFQNSNQ